MRRPRVSVCIPTWRGAATIEAALDSVRAQRFEDFELIVADDASPDDTLQRVQAWRDPRLRIEPSPRNLGPEGNWNRCLALARGDYVKLLPQDDLLHPDCLARQVQALDGRADLSLAFSARDVIGPDGRVRLRARGFGRRARGTVDRDTVLRGCLRQGTNVVGEPGAVLFRRSAAERVGGFSMRHPYVIDLDYWLRLLAVGPGWYEPEALASFRVWRGSWSVSIGRGQAADFRGLMGEALTAAPGAAGPLDRLRGRVMPELNALLRHAFYRWVL